MKTKLFISFTFLFCSFFLNGQNVDSVRTNVLTDTVEGTVYYQIQTISYFDDASIQDITGPKLDSTEMVRRLFRDAHDSQLANRNAVRQLALRRYTNNIFTYNSALLNQITGSDYFELARRRYLLEVPGVYLFRVDTSAVALDDNNFLMKFTLNGQGRAIGREVDNATDQNVIQGGKTLAFQAFESDFFRLVGLVDGQAYEIVKVTGELDDDRVNRRDTYTTFDNSVIVVRVADNN